MESENIKDEDIIDQTDDEITPTKIFSISSYGADYPLEIVPSRISSGDWYAPTFQRNFIWTLKQASRFIESLLLGLPVPGIFLFKELDTGKHLIIDGQQRTKTIELFMNGDDFGSRKFRLSNVAERFDRKTFSELDDDDQRRLKDAILHATIFTQKSPEDGNDSVYEVFERINTGGSKLSAQEIRSCVSHGSLVQLLEELSNDENWKIAFRSNSRRLKDHELILRFFAFYQGLEDYSNPMKRFLDDHMEVIRNPSEEESSHLKNIFIKTIKFITGHIGEKSFRPDRSFNAAVYDCIMVETARKLSESGDIENYVEKYHALTTRPDFLELTLHTTADVDRLRTRFRLANETFSG